jgi:carbamoyltransferase
MSPNVVGLTFGHLSTAALATQNRVVYAQSEERLRGIKNFTGWPSLTYRKLLGAFLQNDPRNVDLIVIPSEANQEFDFFIHRGQFPDGRYFDYLRNSQHEDPPLWFRNRDKAYFLNFIAEDSERVRSANADAALTKAFWHFVTEQSGVPRDRLRFVNHHRAHALSCSINLSNEQWLIVTLDGCGDNLCASVNVWHDRQLEVISTTDRYASPGRFYREVTAYLGFKPDEHEYKVMGLAPYAHPDGRNRLAEKFIPLISIDDELRFVSAFPMDFAKYFLLETCRYERFDDVAGAAQQALEHWVTRWISACIKKTGIRRVALSGGVFMNVKLNQRIRLCRDIDELFVMPSSGDESLPIGCCVAGHMELQEDSHLEPLESLSLGDSFSDTDLENAVAEAKRCGLSVSQMDVTVRAAKHLADGELVGLFSGRPEWGARALGHRSILGNPKYAQTCHKLNRTVKTRDFWMPFASSILDSDLEAFIGDTSKYTPLFMSMAFDTMPERSAEIFAASHPYDQTTRPQLVRADLHPALHQIMSAFKALTGLGAILNTSMNSHGSPLVHSPLDAVNFFKNSDLGFLVLERYLISKGDTHGNN